MDLQSDFDRLLFFEHARKSAEAAYAANPLDADNLTRWGGSLLELSQFQSMEDSKKMIQESITKLEEALTLQPNKHDALWCIGNALTSQAFLNPDTNEANMRFDRAADYFRLAVAEDPSNELYVKSLEVSAKAPELHAEIHKGGALSNATAAAAEPSTSSRGKKSSKKKNSDFKYDVLGWVFLAVGIVTWIGFAKSNMPPPPPPHPQ